MQPTWIHAGDLRRHLKAHSGERSNKCNQCYFAFIQAGNLRPIECSQWRESKKCNWCDLTPIKADDLSNHLKIPPRHVQGRNHKDTS